MFSWITYLITCINTWISHLTNCNCSTGSHTWWPVSVHLDYPPDRFHPHTDHQTACDTLCRLSLCHSTDDTLWYWRLNRPSYTVPPLQTEKQVLICIVKIRWLCFTLPFHRKTQMLETHGYHFALSKIGFTMCNNICFSDHMSWKL